MSEQVVDYRRPRSIAWLPRSALHTIKRRLIAGLQSIQWGCIELNDDEEQVLIGAATNPGPQVRVQIHDRDAYAYIGFGGSVGAGQSYFLGLWDTNDLTGLVRILVHSRTVLDEMDKGWTLPGRLVYGAFHWRRANTLENSRANIAAHYDLGNDFYRLMLDDTMMYSSAVFAHPAQSLHQAQLHKLDLIGQKLQLRAEDHLLEIGTGWGGLAVHLASRFGCRVTTTTISKAQHDVALQRVQALGLNDRVKVLQQDYRLLHGQYDKLVSVEMVEAVGHQFLDLYFRQVSSLLKPDGLALIQAITIEDSRFESYKRSVDFIKRFIFPGGCLPSMSAMMQSLARTSDLALLGFQDIGHDYALTLRHWAANCAKHESDIKALGYSESFMRMWRFYLSYCEGGFTERSISDVQLLFAKPRYRPPQLETPIT